MNVSLGLIEAMSVVYTFHYSDKDSEHNETSVYSCSSREEALKQFRKYHPDADVIQVTEHKQNGVYDIITERILEEMKKGIIPWQRPWHGVRGGAISYTTGKPYSMLNQMLLGRPGEWLTWKQIHELGGRVKPGAKAGMVTFWKVYLKGKDGEDVPEDTEVMDSVDKRFVLRYYNVYHIDDTEGIKSKTEPIEADPNVKPVEEAEKVVEGYAKRNGPAITVCRSNKAYYSPSSDSVTVPLLEQYDEAEHYYSTLFHELTHSTGHKSRLDRAAGMAAHFGSEEYSKEELVAEIGSAMLVNHLGLDSGKAFRNSVAYLQNWLTALKNDSKLIVYAASKAEKAVKFILNIKDDAEAGIANA